MNQSISERFAQLDYFTQKQIIGEFPQLFPENHKMPIPNTKRGFYKELESFKDRQFSMNEFYGGFLLVLAGITLLGEMLKILL